ncbi:IS481 family transposase [uncultured Roseibium sp.]|uniref:IS481 family transposase n=1 Tax=uncultured Roseibium sp. TaxID=1936171 RepID=UPI0032172B0F
MGFRETCAMEERVRFCVSVESGEVSMSELCRQFGISRKTGYEVLRRWRSGGAAALAPRSHAPHHCPHALAETSREAVLALRRRYPSWGPKKLRAFLQAHADPVIVVPAASTIGELLRREGLSVARKRRRRAPPCSVSPFDQALPNDVWSMDFKGWFRTGDGRRCDPFTLQDQASRYLLRVVAVPRPDTTHVWSVLEAAFREFGLPRAIRSDNGAPFASTGAAGLSGLAVRLIKAGVRPERIAPASPQQNGRLERLHRTLKDETANPPAANLKAQADRFVRFRQTYNEERPHEALGMATPAAAYTDSSRPWSGRLRSPDYDQGTCVRRVRQNGEIKWRGGTVYVSMALVGEPVSIEEADTGQLELRYGPVFIGYITEDLKLRWPTRGRKTKTVTHPPG